MLRRARSVAALMVVGLISWAGAASSLSAAVVAAGAADPSNLIIRRSHRTGLASLVTARPAPGVAANKAVIPVNVPRARQRFVGIAFWDQYGPLFGVTDPVSQLAMDKVEVDALGHAHTTFLQMHHGVPVYSGVLRLHQDAQGQVLGASGRYYPIKPTLSIAPAVDEVKAFAIAQAALREQCHPIVEDSHLVIVDPGWYGDRSTGPRLAYFLTLTDLNVGVRQAMFIDAHTGEVLDQWNLNEALLAREIFDGEQGGSIPGFMSRDEGDPAALDAEVNRAYDWSGDFYDFFIRAYGRDSIDNSGMTLRTTVNSRSTGCPNAYWNGMQAVYCTGVVTDDIVAHELCHGIIGATAKLIYQNQSGMLNEHFADVFGELVDLFNGDAVEPGTPGSGPGPFWPNPSASGPGTDAPNNLRTACSPRPFHPNGVRWCIGEDSAGFSGALREMYDPTCRNDPDRAFSPFMLCQADDGGGVHHGSGVPNKAFAMLVDGGVFNSRTIIGIGAIKPGAIWYRALTTYLTPASDFQDAYDALMQSGTDLLGTSPNDPRTGLPIVDTITAFDLQQLDEALRAVELDSEGACGRSDPVLDETTPFECLNPQVVFADDFEGADPGWTVANSMPPTPYDWVRTTTPLPWSRPGAAFFAEARAVGDCAGQNESAAHWLLSPTIAMPSGPGKPMLGFSHHLATEGRFDGGNVEYSVNGGTWTTIPRTAYEFNPPNDRMVTAPTNSSPLAGSDAFSGAGGRWGRTLVNLSSLVTAGQNLQIRFSFGKDGCGGGLGWFVDDFSVYLCPDCDSNTVADVDEFHFRRSSPSYTTVGWSNNEQWVVTAAPLADGPVSLEGFAAGDLAEGNEYVDVSLNGVPAGRLYEVGGTNCSATATRQTLMVPAAAWNAAVASGAGNVTIDLLGSFAMSPFECSGSFISLNVRYTLAAPDQDADGILDACDCATIATHPQPLTIELGQDAVFTAAAGGELPITFQWRFNNVDLVDGPSAGGGVISGATTSTLTITGAGLADAGDYTVVAANTCITPDVSDIAALTVRPPCPTIDTQPQPLTINRGQDAAFSVAATALGTVTYQWFFGAAPLADGPSAGGGIITGAATSALTITGAGFADEGLYSVVIANACTAGPVTSTTAALTLNNPCPADFNESGTVSVQDIFDFLAAYFAGCTAPGPLPCYATADFNNSGGISVQDIFDFLEAYFTGCS